MYAYQSVNTAPQKYYVKLIYCMCTYEIKLIYLAPINNF